MIDIIEERYLISRDDFEVIKNSISSIQNIINNKGCDNLGNKDKTYGVYQEILHQCYKIKYLLKLE